MHGRRGFTLIELMVVVAIIGVLAAIAVPNFLKFQARTRQSEAKVNLKAIFEATQAYYGDQSTYVCGLCSWAVTPGNLYNYYATPSIGLTTGRFGCAPGTVGATAGQTQTGFTATAAANIDTDATCDGWSMNDVGQLSNPSNDVEN